MLAAVVVACAFLSGAASAGSAESIPRPEHPEPQLERAQWLNLNGPWEFWEGDACDEAAALGRAEFPDRIVVPFCRESALSGLGRTGFVKHVVYRRDFELPADWEPGRTLVHVGACDWRTVVWVNGARVAFHEGGSAPITGEITAALRPGRNELRVWAFDDTRSGLQQTGKQAHSEQSEGCVYTRTTGIWQTVWIERVGASFVESLSFTSDFGSHGEFPWHVPLDRAERAATVTLRARMRGPLEGLHLVAEVLRNGKRVSIDSRPAGGLGEALVLTVKNPKLWEPGAPELYDVVVSLRRAAPAADRGELRTWSTGWVEPDERFPVVVDQLRTYFGLRQLRLAGTRVLLNDRPVFQRLVLDQGFFPDGIWTAPTDDALRRDIELAQAAGFNGARLHQKVFEPRFHWWADRLGYLTWGEAPSWGNQDGNPATHRVVAQEWAEIVRRDRNHPSIVGWCPFNETGAASGPLQDLVVALTRELDPSRPVLDTSGYVHSVADRDVDDAHDYDQDPASFRARWLARTGEPSLPARYGRPPPDRPFFVSEYGGIGWIPPGEPGWGYGSVPKSEAEWFARFEGLAAAQLENPGLFAFCYTQLTDVEQERNGLYFYDRRPKFDPARLKAILARPAASESPEFAAPGAASISTSVDWRVLLSSAVDAAAGAPPAEWRYRALAEPLPAPAWQVGAPTTEAPPVGRAGFGTAKPGALVGTPWTTPELYAWREFEWDGAPFGRALLVLHHDNAVEIRLNGELLFERSGWNDAYEPFDVTTRLRALLKPGRNAVAVHVHQDTGGQYFDAALLAAPSVAGD